MAFRLPRLPFNWKDQPALFERYWDEMLNQLEKTLNEILNIPLINAAVIAAQTAATSAQTAATSAQSSADSAQSAVDLQASENSLINSYTSGFTPPLLVADTSGNVTISDHDRVYGDSTLNPTRRVTGGVIATAAATGSVVRLYYNDPGRAGGAVAYLFTVDPSTPPVQGSGIHSVGAVSIPATGTSDGKNLNPPGYVDLS